MHFNTQFVFVAALMANEALAANIHRHHHHRRAPCNKRGLSNVNNVAKYVEEEVTVTDWTTVTVYEDYPKSIYKPGTHHTHTTASLSISASANSTNTTASFTSSTANSSSSSSSTSSSSFSTSLYTTPTTLATSTIAAAASPAAPTPETPTPTPTPTTSTPAPVPTTSSSSSVVVVGAAAAPNTPSAVKDTPTPETTVPTTTIAPTTAQADPTTSTTAAAPTTTAASSSPSSGKRGLAYNSGSLLEPFLGTGTKCAWSYNWGQVADSSAPAGLEFVPMLWSPDSASDWSSNAESAISNGATNFLGFNECDNVGQCNMDAASAATQHIKLMNPYSGRVRIGTPAITNSNLDGEGVSWLTNFLSACGGNCAYDFCTAHWYNSPDTDDFFNHLVQVHEACGKPVWITEFAPLGSDDEINAFLETVLDKLDNDSTYSFVERYSYFMAATGSLLTSETQLSVYGETYAYN